MELLEILDAPPRGAKAVRLRLRLDAPEHMTPELLDRFAAGSATPREGRAVVRHLLARCPSCSRHLGRFVPLERPLEREDAYDQAFDRSLDRVLETLEREH
jgi:hypothetical protein